MTQGAGLPHRRGGPASCCPRRPCGLALQASCKAELRSIESQQTFHGACEQAFAGSIICAVVSSAIPARKAARMEVVEALRHS